MARQGNLDKPVLTPPSPGRSRNMAAIRSKDTKPEISVRQALHAAGFRFRLHRRELPGRPDIVLPRYRRAVFVHGCFWHRHDCLLGRSPRVNSSYWAPKLERTVERDRAAAAALEASGWKVTTIWECSLEGDTAELIAQLRADRPMTVSIAPENSQV